MFEKKLCFLHCYGQVTSQIESTLEILLCHYVIYKSDNWNDPSLQLFHMQITTKFEIKEISNENPGKQTSECTAEDQAMKISDPPKVL